MSHGIRTVAARRFDAAVRGDDACPVVEEEALAIDVEDIGAFTLMWTPTEPVPVPCAFTPQDGVLTDAPGEGGKENGKEGNKNSVPEILALAAGFAFTEGLFDRIDDIRSLAVCADTPGVVRLTLVNPQQVQARRRNVVVGSACGICGGREQIEDILRGLHPAGDALRLTPARLDAIMSTMRQRQAVWLATGGTHAAALFDAEGRVLALAEDLGRHNALDKVIGQCLLAGRPLAGCGTALTSRITLEMVSKAARAGLELVAAVSAASSLAIEAAERCNITLCGFVRNGCATVFTHDRRLLAADGAANASRSPLQIA
ncbi:MAG: formate dehydrogenase accessory sulfurtransferase FdhD [Zoogloeaceae bacterium]|jgi:FdhD protein|nr:formate dehydrogenase accessory sulfurtransferase FdhD [Zoogloeaceae bacterium]